MTSRKTSRLWISLCGFVFCLSAVCVGAGCSKVLLGKKPDVEKNWTCDNEADDAMKRNDYESGISLHERFLEKEPENALALYHLGYAYGQRGEHAREVMYYEKAIAFGYKKNRIFFNLGMAYGELNKTEKAIYAFKQALDMDPGNADNHFGLAMAYQRSAEDKLAEKAFLKAIEIDPRHVEARLLLSLLYADWGERDKADYHLRKVLEIDPDNSRAREFLERIERE
jgi:tetratricopeptide (TPR) repeat protein